jgi:purine-cytosine permease-like protein
MSAIQIASSYSGINGIVFFQRRACNYIVSAIVALPCMAVLITWNWHKDVGVIEGAEQFYLFMAGILSAIILTLLTSSLVNHRRFKNKPTDQENGFEALKNNTFYQAIIVRLRSIKCRG